MRLYDSSISANSHKIRMLLARLQMPYERVAVNILAGEARTPTFIRKNVAHRVPVLELEDGQTIAESGAILAYLARGTPYLPDDPVAQAQVLRWLFFEQNQIEPTIAVVRFLTRWGNAPEPVFDWLRRRGIDGLRVMETHLERRQYFAGSRETIADIALFGYTHLAREGGFDLDPYPAVVGWHERVAAHPLHLPMERSGS